MTCTTVVVAGSSAPRESMIVVGTTVIVDDLKSCEKLVYLPPGHLLPLEKVLPVKQWILEPSQVRTNLVHDLLNIIPV